VAEHLAHLVFGHGAESATRPALAELHVPGAAAGKSARTARRRSGLLVHPPVRAELVVLLPLLGIAEHFVCFVNLLGPRLSGLVARIHIRMVLAGELPVCLLDLFFGGGLRDAERRVIVFEFHITCAPSLARAS